MRNLEGLSIHLHFNTLQLVVISTAGRSPKKFTGHQ